MTPEREKEIRAQVDETWPGQWFGELLAALDECRRERDALTSESIADAERDLAAGETVSLDEVEFYRWKDSIEQTLVYVSNHVGGGDHDTEIAEMVKGLLAKLGVE